MLKKKIRERAIQEKMAFGLADKIEKWQKGCADWLQKKTANVSPAVMKAAVVSFLLGGAVVFVGIATGKISTAHFAVSKPNKPVRLYAVQENRWYLPYLNDREVNEDFAKYLDSLPPFIKDSLLKRHPDLREKLNQHKEK